MENTKTVKIVIAFSVICLMYMLLIFLLNFNKKDQTSGYIINSNLGGFYCQASRCEWVRIEEIDLTKSFDVYQRNKNLGFYEMEYALKWNFYQQNKWQEIYGDFIAISKDLKHEILPYQLEEFTFEDYEMIQNILREKGLENYTTLNNEFAYVLDLDNNGIKDKVIAVSNQTEAEKSEEYFTLFIIVLNEKMNIVYEENVINTNGFILPYYDLMEAIKINNTIKLVINKSYFNNAGNPSTILLEISNNKIVEETKGE